MSKQNVEQLFFSHWIMLCKYTRITAKIYVDLFYIIEYLAICLRCDISVVNSDNKFYLILDTTHRFLYNYIKQQLESITI